jgi:hypothetical protein
MERMNNAIADPTINPTMNDLESGRFHIGANRDASRSGGVRGSSDRSLQANTKHQAPAHRGG